MLTRIMCVGPGRLYEAACVLSLDANIQATMDQTLVISPYSETVIKHEWDGFNINYENLKIISDTDIPQYPAWCDSHWYWQQAIKLHLLTTVDSDQFLIQDMDVFCNLPYQPFDPGVTFRVEDVWNPQQQVYSEMVEKITGFARAIPVSFVTEIMPYYKQDWLDCAALIKRKLGNEWHAAIPSIQAFDNSKWFSEYELLGMYKTNVGDDYKIQFDTLTSAINSWEDFESHDWSQVPTVKFKARPLKFMSKSEAKSLVKRFTIQIV
jgi:hypothetical protein